MVLIVKSKKGIKYILTSVERDSNCNISNPNYLNINDLYNVSFKGDYVVQNGTQLTIPKNDRLRCDVGIIQFTVYILGKGVVGSQIWQYGGEKAGTPECKPKK